MPGLPSPEGALAAFGSRVLTVLENAIDKSCRLFDIVDKAGLQRETLFPMIDSMTQLGLIEVLESHKYGNHKFGITPAGEGWLSQRRSWFGSLWKRIRNLGPGASFALYLLEFAIVYALAEWISRRF
jgi:hypothetical protein